MNITNKVRIFIYLLFTFTFISSSCNSIRFEEDKPLKSIVPGKYTTKLISESEKKELIKKHGNHFRVSIAVVLDLKSDSTFRMGYCNRKVKYTGKWSINGDSVIIYDTYNLLTKNLAKNPRRGFYFNKYGEIYMPFGSLKGEDITILKIGGDFDGILEDEQI
jgi:hypothetical protein